MSRVQSYIPVALVTIAGFLPVALIATFSDMHQVVFTLTVFTVMAIKIHTSLRLEVLIFDTMPIALELLGMTLYVGFMDAESVRRIWIAFTICWCVFSSIYRMTLHSHDRNYSLWTSAFTTTAMVSLSLLTPVAPTFRLSAGLVISRSGAYMLFSIFDNYALALYTAKREVPSYKTELTYFLHGPILLAPDASVLVFCVLVFFFSHIFGIVFMHKSNASKKNDDIESLPDHQRTSYMNHQPAQSNTMGALGISAISKSNSNANAHVTTLFSPSLPVSRASLQSAPITPHKVTQPSRSLITETHHTIGELEEEFQKALAIAQL